MKLIALALALFSFSAIAETLDCRENLAGSYNSYQIQFEGGAPQTITINTAIYPARGYYDYSSRWIAISAETENDVFEFSYNMDQAPGRYHFSKINLTTYYNGHREILCRLKD
ncbi:MAG: hypothetical protein V4598_00290 [Bdellovibrionota bacterium]